MKALLIALVLLCSSCTTSFDSPLTGIRYTGKIDADGFSITAKPPFYDLCIQLYNWITD